MAAARTPLLRLLCAISIALAAVPAGAANIEVAPVNIEMSGTQRASSLTVVNREERAVTIQVRAFAWNQERGEETLVPTAELALSPPIFTLPAGERQLLRIFVRGNGGAGREQSYRLLIDEIPSASAENAVHLAVRISIPVFHYSGPVPRANLTWAIQAESGNTAWLVATNSGNRRVKLAKLAVAAGGGSRELPVSQPAYLLPGSVRQWRLENWKTGDTPDLSVAITGLADIGAIDARAKLNSR